jgi:hypothetical protein
VADSSSNPIAAALNTRRKYVASTTLTDPQWAGTTILWGDVAAAIGEPNAKPGSRAASARQRQLNASVDHPDRDGVTIVHAT